ncbi:hypothetical protein H8K47_14665 [Undibacterium sp. CY7W]|uniref:Uncharacterized protein n=1 Tax=Undibacterium rugosum TaxID=2762291 RepID=A0A923KWJ0_9BURK|nr:hypothetical protein [Undibacterium rugosum]MBC3936607.1 hypothetical protein [Undibacterium rugosum]
MATQAALAVLLAAMHAAIHAAREVGVPPIAWSGKLSMQKRQKHMQNILLTF